MKKILFKSPSSIIRRDIILTAINSGIVTRWGIIDYLWGHRIRMDKKALRGYIFALADDYLITRIFSKRGSNAIDNNIIQITKKGKLLIKDPKQYKSNSKY